MGVPVHQMVIRVGREEGGGCDGVREGEALGGEGFDALGDPRDVPD
eukprot:CAMPEP_0184399752 /NCGR_PEP_ID=MMETSP0007-20130409/71761_1 /TAXON_ID=97485 /ORGANISM="Prymnesium parvum, Strain Texoma1" /LENGTH=45 /DNA_ID= /DNA_START= /DNA_END= /DNA_ORIENTATION=